MTPFLMNAWYMAAWSHEIPPNAPFGRTLLGMPVAIYRRADGSPVALYNRCPHRFAPLELGKVKGDELECGYHGLRFDGTGACVHNPHGGPPPRAARVRSYPVVERDHIIWLWPGDPAQADPTRIPHFEHHADARYRFIWGMSSVAANFELITDNLLDLSHVSYLHPGFGGAAFQPQFRMESTDQTVTAIYFTSAMPNSPFGEGSFNAGGRLVDELDVMRWSLPAAMQLEVFRNFTGEEPRAGALQPSAHILTPETPDRTHYFWGSGMPLNSPLDDAAHRVFLTQAFEAEDKPMIGAVERAMAGEDFWALKPVLLQIDSASVRARRVLQKHREAQNAALANAASN